MQSAFVDLGLERDAFLYVTDFMEEQEDSADFEKVPTGNGGGSGGRSREGQAPREAQAGREPREPRPSRTSDSTENDGAFRLQRRTTQRLSTPNGSGEAAAGDEDQQGTRRWRGRRGRRRGGRPREAGQAQAQPRTSSDLTSGIEEVEVETGPTVYEETVAHGGGQAAFAEAPTTSYGSPARHSSPDRETAPAARAAAASTPIVLPGESLSRYGSKPAYASTHLGP